MPAFTLNTFSLDVLPGMLALHNAQTAHEPLIGTLTPDLFTSLVLPKPWFDPTGLFVARQEGQVIGWIHACAAPGTEPWSLPETVYHLRMFLFPPDRPEVGRALLDAATDWLKAQGGKRLMAFHPSHGYPLYRGVWLGGEPMLPYSFPHAHMLLETGGYKLASESVVMTAPLEAEPAEEIPSLAGFELEDEPVVWASEAMRASWAGFDPRVARAYVDGAPAGFIGWVLIPSACTRLGAPDVNIWGMSTEPPFRRHGVAGALVARVLRHGWRLGARSASLSTQLWNAPAQGLYARFGYRPHLIMAGRVLEVG
jgi:GNAT superfamily N-acetyltransferase